SSSRTATCSGGGGRSAPHVRNSRDPRTWYVPGTWNRPEGMCRARLGVLEAASLVLRTWHVPGTYLARTRYTGTSQSADHRSARTYRAAERLTTFLPSSR